MKRGRKGRHHAVPSRRGIAAELAAAFAVSVVASMIVSGVQPTLRHWAGAGFGWVLMMWLVIRAVNRMIDRLEATDAQLDDWVAETYGGPDVRGGTPTPRKTGPYRGDLEQVPPPGESPFQTDFPSWAEATTRLDYRPDTGREGVSAAALRPIAVPVFRNETDRDAWAERHDMPTEILPIMPDSTS